MKNNRETGNPIKCSFRSKRYQFSSISLKRYFLSLFESILFERLSKNIEYTDKNDASKKNNYTRLIEYNEHWWGLKRSIESANHAVLRRARYISWWRRAILMETNCLETTLHSVNNNENNCDPSGAYMQMSRAIIIRW